MAAKLAAGLKWFVVGVIDSFMVMLLLMKAFFGSSLAREHRPSFGKLFKGWQTCRYFGRNLGSLKSETVQHSNECCYAQRDHHWRIDKPVIESPIGIKEVAQQGSDGEVPDCDDCQAPAAQSHASPKWVNENRHPEQ